MVNGLFRQLNASTLGHGAPALSEFSDHFSDRAARYAAHRPTYPAALVDFLASAAPRTRLAWDAGCGSGQLSTSLARRFERVVATDSSAEQLANAPRHPNVHFVRARAEASGLRERIADLAVTAQAAHWFDLDDYYAEARIVGRPGGVIALVSYGVPTVDESIDRVMHRFYGDTLLSYWAPERRHVEDGYRSLPFPFEEIEAPRMEIHVEWTLTDLLGYVATWSAVRALEKAKGHPAIQGFRLELAHAWGSHVSTRSIRWPLSMRVGRL